MEGLIVQKWKELIVIMLMVQDEMMKADNDNLWEYHYPKVACKPSDITDIENKIGKKLNQDYIDFLLCANGWNCFYQMVDLFGTNDLISDKMNRAKELLEVEVYYNEELKSLSDRLLPIAVSRDDIDLFVIVLGDGDYAGNVIWLAGGEIDRFESFTEFFKSMLEYNKSCRDDLINNAI